MARISPRLRIFITLVIAFLVIKILPSYLTSSPHLITKDELLSLFVLPSITMPSFQFGAPIHTQPASIEISPTPMQDNSFFSPKKVLDPSPIPQLQTTPYSNQVVEPTVEEKPIIPPSLPPTIVPTNKPIPTTSQSRTPNYSVLSSFVSNMPIIGCRNNTTNGCSVDSLYKTPVDKGLGWATFYGEDHTSGKNVVAETIHNNKKIALEAARAFIDETYMQKQSNMTPDEAKKTGKVIAYAATRSPADLWKIKYMFGIDDINNPKVRFIGRIMIVDCAAQTDWVSSFSTLSYGYKGWKSLNWIVELSRNGFIQIPTGLSGSQENVGEGRPGVIIIDEASLDSLIY